MCLDRPVKLMNPVLTSMTCLSQILRESITSDICVNSLHAGVYYGGSVSAVRVSFHDILQVWKTNQYIYLITAIHALTSDL